MIDKEVIWNLGSWNTPKITTKEFYEKERGINPGSSGSPSEWSIMTDVGEKHNGIGLIYPSDFGYAVGGKERINCLTKNLFDYDGDNCKSNDWLDLGSTWTLSPDSSYKYFVFYIDIDGYLTNEDVNVTFDVWPTLYLTTSTKIVDGTGEIGSPFILK